MGLLNPSISGDVYLEAETKNGRTIDANGQTMGFQFNNDTTNSNMATGLTAEEIEEKWNQRLEERYKEWQAPIDDFGAQIEAYEEAAQQQGKVMGLGRGLSANTDDLKQRIGNQIEGMQEQLADGHGTVEVVQQKITKFTTQHLTQLPSMDNIVLGERGGMTKNWKGVQDANLATVEEGSSIWNMTKEHFGLENSSDIANKVNEVLALNGLDQTSARNIQAGQKIVMEDPMASDGSMLVNNNTSGMTLS